MPLAAGTMVTPHVKLVQRIGSGGMGSVWMAEHLRLNTTVAVKLLAEGEMGKPGASRRFEREAGLAAQLKSPHAVRIFDYGFMPDERPYIVMELLDGETLAQRLRRDGKVAPAAAATIISQLAAVIGHAHDLGIVHRDVKPSNIFLLSSEYEVFVKLLDFGIAKPLDDNEVSPVTETGTILGTPHYCSPEQLLGKKRLDNRTDLWSLGVVAHEMLVGQRPFDEPTMAALTMAICHGDYTPPSELVDDAPAALDDFFGRVLCVAREDRFDDARQLAEAFCAAMSTLASPDEPLVMRDPVATGPHESDVFGEPGTDSPASSTLAAASTVVPVTGARQPWRWWVAAAAVASVTVLSLAVRETPLVARAGLASPIIAVPAALPIGPSLPTTATVVAPTEPSSSAAKPSRGALAPGAPRKGKPAFCNTDDGYERDARGYLVPKAECL